MAAAGLAMRGAQAASELAVETAALDLGDAERLRGLRERVSRTARTYLLTGDERYLADERAAEAAFNRELLGLQQDSTSSEETALFEKLQRHVLARRIIANDLVELKRSGAGLAVIGRVLEVELQPVLDAFDATVAEVVDRRSQKVVRTRAEANATSSGALWFLGLAAALALLIAGFSSQVLSRTLNRIEGGAERTRRHLSAIVESSEDGVFSTDLEGHLTSWNQGAERIFGYASTEVMGQRVSLLVPTGMADDFALNLHRLRVGERLPQFEVQRQAKDGRVLNVALTISSIKDERGGVISVSTIARDITEARKLRLERDRFFELSLDMVCVAGLDGFFKQLNPAFETTLGFSRAELMTKSIIEGIYAEDRASAINELRRLGQGIPTTHFEARHLCRDGSFRWFSWRAWPSPEGSIYAVARDITDDKETQMKLASLTEEMRRLAISDELTGLHNRRGFHLLAEQHLKSSARVHRPAVFFFADLDGLKRINDTLGHDVGDRAIRDMARLLMASFRQSDIIARLGGDEFVILAVDLTEDRAQMLLDRLNEQVRQHNLAQPQPYALSVSIGFTTYNPNNPESVEAIIKRADVLMYEKKAQRRSHSAQSAA